MTDFRSPPNLNGVPLVTQVEDDFTPSITFATPGTLSIAYSAQAGRWVRTGSVVDVEINIQTTTLTKGTAAGEFRVDISGATAETGTPVGYLGAFVMTFHHSNFDLPITGGQEPINLIGRLAPGGDYITMHYTTRDFGDQVVDVDDIKGNVLIRLSGRYRVAT